MMSFDYETMRIIWWAFLGIIIISFAVTSGFDMGISLLLPFLGKNDEQRQVIINVIEPTWGGNQVWFIMFASALFAAWPLVYAVSFLSLYFVLLLILFALFLRPLGFAYRDKLPGKKWRTSWDWALFLGGSIPALVCGITFGNLLKGIPFHFENDLRIIYFGNFLDLLNPFSLLAGFVSLSMFIMHGAVYLQIKTLGCINKRAKKQALFFTLLTLILFASAGVWVSSIEGYHITSEVVTDAVSNPMAKTVKQETGLWLDNYGHLPGLWGVPASAFIAGLMVIILIKANRPGFAFVFSCVTIVAILLTVGCTMFPFIIPSSISVNSSLTVWDSSSSQATLNFMFWVMIIFLPITFVYTSWVFRVFRGKKTVEHVRNNSHALNWEG